MARFHTGLHGGRAGGLHADDLHIGVEQLGQRTDAGGQTAAADGHQNDVHIGQVAEDLIGDGALAGGHGQIVEGRDVGHALALGQFHGLGGSVVKRGAVEDDLRSVALGVVHLQHGGGGGHDHRGADACMTGSIGHALGVVARGGGDQAEGLLLLGKGADLKIGAADLIGAGHLHIFRFQVNIVAAGSGKRRGVDQVSLVNDTGEHAPGGFKAVKGHHRT